MSEKKEMILMALVMLLTFILTVYIVESCYARYDAKNINRPCSCGGKYNYSGMMDIDKCIFACSDCGKVYISSSISAKLFKSDMWERR
jgi:hypothetical protein